MTDEFGDFEEIIEEDSNGNAVEGQSQEGEGPVRVRLPRDGEHIGKVVQRLGGNKMDVMCDDGKNRNSRVPGRFRRKFWLRPGDFVIVKGWEFDDSKADIIHQYRKGPQVDKLRKIGKLDNLKDSF